MFYRKLMAIEKLKKRNFYYQETFEQKIFDRKLMSSIKFSEKIDSIE